MRRVCADVPALLQRLYTHVVVHPLARVHCFRSLFGLIRDVHCVHRLQLAEAEQNIGLHAFPILFRPSGTSFVSSLWRRFDLDSHDFTVKCTIYDTLTIELIRRYITPSEWRRPSTDSGYLQPYDPNSATCVQNYQGAKLSYAVDMLDKEVQPAFSDMRTNWWLRDDGGRFSDIRYLIIVKECNGAVTPLWVCKAEVFQVFQPCQITYFLDAIKHILKYLKFVGFLPFKGIVYVKSYFGSSDQSKIFQMSFLNQLEWFSVQIFSSSCWILF